MKKQKGKSQAQKARYTANSIKVVPLGQNFKTSTSKITNPWRVCAYIKETHYKYERLDYLNCCDDHECLWIYLRPTRLPRGLTCIITSVIYHPPGTDGAILLDHLFHSLTLVESKYPNCGLIVTGDFNRLDLTRLLNHFRLKQTVKIPTRNDLTLD